MAKFGEKNTFGLDVMDSVDRSVKALDYALMHYSREEVFSYVNHFDKLKEKYKIPEIVSLEFDINTDEVNTPWHKLPFAADTPEEFEKYLRSTLPPLIERKIWDK